MAQQDQDLIDPALQAEDDYRSSLSGIYPSQGRANNDHNNNDSSEGRLEDVGDQGYEARPHPPPSRQDNPGKKKKRASGGVDEDGRKKSRQSRE